jgi:iron-sulfur cluster repair protein YtfE (RIC family)
MARAEPHRLLAKLGLAAPSDHLLDDPLEYLLAEHARHRQLGAIIKRFVAMGRASRSEAGVVATLLLRDLVLHHRDEEEDLFPALRHRAQADDAVGVVLERLTEDHRQSASEIFAIIDTMRIPAGQQQVELSANDAALLSEFVENQHRHFAFENAVVLALARIRLTRKDIATMSHNMKLRRGITQ